MSTRVDSYAFEKREGTKEGKKVKVLWRKGQSSGEEAKVFYLCPWIHTQAERSGSSRTQNGHES